MTVTLKPEEQSTEINDVIAGSFQAAAWRNHPGFDPDTQWVWWHCSVPAAATPTPASPNIGMPTADGQTVGNNCDNPVNFSQFNDPEINKDLETGRTSTDPAVRGPGLRGPQQGVRQAGLVRPGRTGQCGPFRTRPMSAGILGPNLPTATDANVTSSGPQPYTGLSSGTDVSGLWIKS